MLIVDGKKADSYEEFKNRIVGYCVEIENILKAKQLKIVITDIAPPKSSIIPFNHSKVAVISIYGIETSIAPLLPLIDDLRGVYQVTEAIPVGYKKDWSDGTKTPGVNLLTLFRQKSNIDYDTFTNNWFNGHTPLSLKIHPLWNYNRNMVNANELTSSPWYDGIVEEQVKEKADLLDPFKFFGGPFRMIPNMLRVYFDVKKFIDYSSIETYLANEYWIKS